MPKDETWRKKKRRERQRSKPDPRVADRNRQANEAFVKFVIVGLVLVGFAFVVYKIIKMPPADSNDPAMLEIKVKALAEKTVKRHLKAPSTATFDHDPVTVLPSGSFNAAGAFDAQNAFGVPLRHSYELVVKRFDGRLIPGQLKINGQIIE